MEKSRTYRSIRYASICMCWAACSILILRFVGDQTGISRGFDATTGDAMIVYSLMFVLFLIGEFAILVVTDSLDGKLKDPIPGWLMATVPLVMIAGIVKLSPSIPLPN